MNGIQKNRPLCMVVVTAWILVIVSILNLFILLAKVDAEQKVLPFQIGEYLLFHIYWGFIKVGETVMEVLPNTTVDGQFVRHFRLKTRTTPFIDLIYKVEAKLRLSRTWK